MKITDEMRSAGFKALAADGHWHKPDSAGVWRTSYTRAVDLVLEAVLPLTDDGAAADESEWADEERDFVGVALRAADAGNAGHWPTVATYLAAEVRRLRAGEGATPAIDREALARAVHNHFCIRRFEKNHDPRRGDYEKADEILGILALVGAPNSGASEEDQ